MRRQRGPGNLHLIDGLFDEVLGAEECKKIFDGPSQRTRPYRQNNWRRAPISP